MMILISSDDSDENMKYEEMRVDDSMDSMETRTTEVKAACRANIAIEQKKKRKATSLQCFRDRLRFFGCSLTYLHVKDRRAH
jgi:hypothetical protein